MRSIYFLFFFLFLSHIVQSQEISARIFDKSTNSPIPFVAVQTAEYKGVISNEEGVFYIQLEDVSDNSITLSCLGYQTITLNLDTISASDYVISLEPAVNELDTVYISNSRPNVDSIISRVKRNLKINYPTEKLEYSIFHRTTSYVDFEDLEFKINKASSVRKKQLETANSQLDAMAKDIQSSNSVFFQDVSGDLYFSDTENKKMRVDKATKIINTKKDFSLDNIQEKAYQVVLKYLDTTKTFKLKTGLFKIEDSLSLSESDEPKSINEFEVKDLKSNASSVLYQSHLGQISVLKKVLNADNYEYNLKTVNTYLGEIVYHIQFSPRRSRASFTGNLYVVEDDYGVLKLDYAYAKGRRGEKINLKLILGVKYIENEYQGTIIYTRDSSSHYVPRYIKHETGEYFYLNRPLKFIENSEEKNKTAFNVLVEGQTRNREEILFRSVNSLDQEAFDQYKELKKVNYETLRKYDANQWTGQQAIAPTAELSAFEVDD